MQKMQDLFDRIEFWSPDHMAVGYAPAESQAHLTRLRESVSVKVSSLPQKGNSAEGTPNTSNCKRSTAPSLQ